MGFLLNKRRLFSMDMTADAGEWGKVATIFQSGSNVSYLQEAYWRSV